MGMKELDIVIGQYVNKNLDKLTINDCIELESEVFN